MMTLEQLPPKGVKREQAILELGKDEANGELLFQLVNTEKGKCKTAAQKALAQLEYAPAAPLWAKLVRGKWMGSNIMSDACSDCVSEQIAPVILKTLSQLLDEGDTKPLDIEQLNFCFHLMLGKASPKMLEVYRFLAENTQRIAQLKRAPVYSDDDCTSWWITDGLRIWDATPKEKEKIPAVVLTASLIRNPDERLQALADELNEHYICCDLKSFYASVECVERGLDPMTTNLVVADKRRTEKTICLAVSPPLKAYGISGRARLFEVVQRVKEVNALRQQKAPGRKLTGSSWNDPEVQNNSSLALDYIVAPPRMAHYIDWSTKIYSVYLKYVAPEDIFPYSIDEVFMDITNYLDTYKMTARELTRTIILDILKTTGITAAAGMGTNLYLAKIAMDIVAKHVHPDQDGVRIAKLNEMTYRRLLWDHRPLTDFWRVGKGYANKLEAHGLYTMGDIARCSIGQPGDYHNEELLYKLFGVNAEILIDHAWGWEPCTIADIKAYKPENKSIVSGQVLQCPYDFQKARLVVREMADALALDLVDKGLVTNQLVLTVGYDRENLDDPSRRQSYRGPVTTDRYGRKIPKHAVGTENFPYTSSASDLLKAVSTLYDRIVDENLLIRRLSISANKLLPEADAPKEEAEQLDLFADYAAKEQREQVDKAAHTRERKIQEAMLGIKKRYGKNAILKGMNLEEGATARERNQTIGGHHA